MKRSIGTISFAATRLSVTVAVVVMASIGTFHRSPAAYGQVATDGSAAMTAATLAEFGIDFVRLGTSDAQAIETALSMEGRRSGTDKWRRVFYFCVNDELLSHLGELGKRLKADERCPSRLQRVESVGFLFHNGALSYVRVSPNVEDRLGAKEIYSTAALRRKIGRPPIRSGEIKKEDLVDPNADKSAIGRRFEEFQLGADILVRQVWRTVEGDLEWVSWIEWHWLPDFAHTNRLKQ